MTPVFSENCAKYSKSVCNHGFSIVLLSSSSSSLQFFPQISDFGLFYSLFLGSLPQDQESQHVLSCWQHLEAMPLPCRFGGDPNNAPYCSHGEQKQ